MDEDNILGSIDASQLYADVEDYLIIVEGVLDDMSSEDEGFFELTKMRDSMVSILENVDELVEIFSPEE